MAQHTYDSWRNTLLGKLQTQSDCGYRKPTLTSAFWKLSQAKSALA
jgi:hypothetical protein